MGTLKKILGIESTAHTIGIGIAIGEAPYIVANEKSTYVPEKGVYILENPQDIWPRKPPRC